MKSLRLHFPELKRNKSGTDLTSIFTAISIKLWHQNNTHGKSNPYKKAEAKSSKSNSPDVEKKESKKRRSFPLNPFEESFEFAKEIYKLGAGEKVRRLTLFDNIGKSPDSGPSRMMITNSNKYGLTKGSYVADFLELEPKGLKAVAEDSSPVLSLQAKFELCISDFQVYNFLYTKFSGNKIPAKTVVSDLLSEEFKSEQFSKEEAVAIVDNFIVNIKYWGLLQTIAGAERIISLEHALEKIPGSSALIKIGEDTNKTEDLVEVSAENSAIRTYENFDKICFYITPIGEDASEFRKHSDLFLESIISPALEPFGLKVVRADKIEKPGTITNQIIEYVFKSRLVIADLSFHNPNVFYELALRHVCRLPTIQIIRKSDRLPFDVSQSRTILIDTSDIYSLVPKLETHKAEIANQVRQLLANPEAIDNPITNVFPKVKFTI